MRLRFHWMLPKGGEMMKQETSRVITTQKQSLAGLPDMDNWIRFAEHAEDMGIESLLLSFGNYEPDTLHITCALGRATKTLKFIAAYRLGLMQPSIFVQQINTLSHLIEGRIALNIIAGSSPAEQRGYGDFLAHDERYARAEEFLAVCKHFWSDQNPFDFNGKYCQVRAATLNTRYFTKDRTAPEIYVAGHSQAAEQLALSSESCWLRMIDTPANLSPLVERTQQAGVGMCLRLSLVCRPTRQQALKAAKILQADQQTKSQVRNFFKKSDSQVLKESLSSADRTEWLNDYLWTGLVPSYGPSAITMVGTADDLAQAFLEYKRIGVSQFIISGWPKLEEMMIFGREILPLVRKAEFAEYSH